MAFAYLGVEVPALALPFPLPWEANDGRQSGATGQNGTKDTSG